MPPGPAGTYSGRDIGNHQPGRCVTRATMLLAYAPTARSLRRQKVGRCVDKALQLGALAALLAEVGAASADSSREPGLSRWLVKSRKTWVMRRSCGR